MDLTRRKALIGLCVAAVPAPRAASAAQRPLRISVPMGLHQKMIEELGTRFTKANPAIAVEFLGKGDSWDPLLQVTLREGLVNGLPDATWQSLAYARLLARRGYIQPLDPLAGGRAAFTGSASRSLCWNQSLAIAVSTRCRSEPRSLSFTTTWIS
ncbi:ABC-type glycerol-3-phosphate transport system substrate-binding protein [Bradyrhizobium sp. I1.8.5]|uniref:hypothetical protein n=1 Tax=Bradyrhizobium sp. I1.8.5 TaxID=3156365 RepID=UPI0033996711